MRRAVDENPAAGRYMLTGSAPTGPTHSGAARITPIRMRPMTLAERRRLDTSVSLSDLLAGRRTMTGATSFGLTDYADEITAGGFPGLRSLPPSLRSRQLDGYLDRIVDRDFPEAGTRVRRPAAVTAWLRAYAAATATTASFEQVRKAASLGESTPARSTVQPYIDLLTQLRVLDPIDGWQPTRNHLRRLTSSPKHHLADPALAARLLRVTAHSLLTAQQPVHHLARDGPILGVLFESLVTHSVRVAAQAAGCDTFHLRTRDGRQEIDLIVQNSSEEVLAVEVKLAAHVDDDDVRHLLWLREKNAGSVIDLVVVNTGPRAYRRPDGVTVVPLALLGP